MNENITDLYSANETLADEARSRSAKLNTDSPEYRRAKREGEASALVAMVLDVLNFMDDSKPINATQAAMMIQRHIADALHQASRDGAFLAINAASSVKV